MQNQENKREKRKLTLPQLKLIVGSAALVVLTVLQVEWEVNDEAKEIQVTMPEIRVLSSEVDLESFKLYHENWSHFRPIRTEEFNAAAQAMKVEAQNRAVENGLLDNAQENAERVIQGFIHQNFDPQEYKIVFEYEKGAAA